MARKLRSKKGSKIYAQRKAIVKPVNGQIKDGRSLRRFLLRGVEKVDGEWHVIAATHNLLKLSRFRRGQRQELMAVTGCRAAALVLTASSESASSGEPQGSQQQPLAFDVTQLHCDRGEQAL
jgi:hypothetical protein